MSPYFVPGEGGLKLMRAAIDNGIRISVMTNSLASTDEPLAYGGYARYRAPMLKLGVSLSELSPLPNRRFDMLGDMRSSLGRLHAKVAVVDRRWLVVGSMNMDGRSSRSNTELSLVIDDIGLATAALALMHQRWSDSHYRLRIAGAERPRRVDRARRRRAGGLPQRAARQLAEPAALERVVDVRGGGAAVAAGHRWDGPGETQSTSSTSSIRVTPTRS